jgi:cholesterol transport system auxiliary component
MTRFKHIAIPVWLNFLLLLLSGFTLVGCSVFKPVERPTINNYELAAEAKHFPQAKPSSLVLFVNNTQAGPGYETSSIVYTKSPFQINYFAKNRWIAPPAQMINKALVDSLQQSHYFKAIATVPYVGSHDLRLDTRLLELKQNFQTDPSQVSLVLVAQLIDAKRQAIIASKQFKVSVNTTNSPEGGITAANQALSRLLEQIVVFCVHNSQPTTSKK